MSGDGREHELLSLPGVRQAVRHFRFGRRQEKGRRELDVPLLGEVPLNMQIRILGDEGKIGASFDDKQSGPY